MHAWQVFEDSSQDVAFHAAIIGIDYQLDWRAVQVAYMHNAHA